MAQANTFSMERGGFFFTEEGCAICGEKASRRAFYYPTYMNGDAEWLGDYCENHKRTDVRLVANGEIPVRYALPDCPKANVVTQ